MRECYLVVASVIDAILKVKMNQFNERFVTEEELYVIMKLLENRLQKSYDKVWILSDDKPKEFDLNNGVYTRSEAYRSLYRERDIDDIVYDESFIQLCLCELMMTKLKQQICSCANCKSDRKSNHYCGHEESNALHCMFWTTDLCTDNCISEIINAFVKKRK